MLVTHLGQNPSDVGCPQVQRLPTLGNEVVPLIYGRDSRDRAGLMIKDFVRDMRRHPKPSHPGDAGPAQIVKAPSGHTRQLIQPAFRSTEFLERLGSEQRKDIWPPLVRAFEHGHWWIGQVYDMGLGVLGPW